MSSKLFTFNRSLPAPFDKVAKKVKVSSTYGDGTEATLSSTVVKAVLTYCACMDGSKPGAVGLGGTRVLRWTITPAARTLTTWRSMIQLLGRYWPANMTTVPRW